MAKPKAKLLLYNFFLRIRPVLRWVIKLRSSPKAIAGGLALGTFVAFTPTYGVQIFLVVFLATILGLNRPAALIPVWITNPVTIAPIYTFNYWLGSFIYEGPPLGQVSKLFLDIAVKLTKLDFWDIRHQIVEFFIVGKDIIIPLTIGCCFIGVVSAILTYFVSLKFLEFFLKRRKKK